ncbi:hypothetical protein MMC18_006930 [Xylographa bjoerkii]|nr:hypothetical protein [Xylographa bjoerkii]
MANSQRPDLAALVGEKPLDGDYLDTADTYTSEPEMDCGHTSNEPMLAQLANGASKLPENPEPYFTLIAKSDQNLEKTNIFVDLAENANKSRQHSPERLRIRPKIHTRPLTPEPNGVHDVEYTPFKKESPRKENIAANGAHMSRMNTSEMKVQNGNLSPSSRLPTSRPDDRSVRTENDSLATSPNLSKYTIPNPQGSHMDILPAMQNSPPQSANSPTGLHNLPSIHSKLGSLVDGPLPPDRGLRSTGIPLQNTPSFPPIDASVHSPPMDFKPPRVPHYGSNQTRPNGQFHHNYPTTEPSPASTVSEASPRDTYRHSQDPTSMSPPGVYTRQFPSTSMTPQSEVQTPLSAESLPSASSYSTETSPNGDRMSIDGDRPILPPLNASAPVVGAGFKCDYTGCTAPPFLTQYLLK